MILDLFVTHYNEPWSVGKAGFDLLSNQRCVDWDNVRVVLVHDGTEKFPEEYFAEYPFKVHQYSIEHIGIAGVRNWCLDNSTAEWIKWNDFDDLFSSVYSLKNIMDSLYTAKDYDLLWFDAYAEYNNRLRLMDKRDPVVLHGKVFRRSFIMDKKLRFNNDLTWCEDSAFLAIMEMEIDHSRIGKIACETPLYSWVYRKGSLCNRPEIKFSNLQSFFRRHVYVYNEFVRRGLTDQANTMVARIMCDSYYTFKLAGVTENMNAHEQLVWDFFVEHKPEFLKVTKEMMKKVIDATNEENIDCYMTLDDLVSWLKELRKKHEGRG